MDGSNILKERSYIKVSVMGGLLNSEERTLLIANKHDGIFC